MDIVVWLRSLGLGKYEAAFRENEIDETVLPSLTHETLKELGVTAVGTGSRYSMPSLLSVTTRAVRRPRLTLRPRRVPQAHIQKTAPNAAKSR